MPYDLLIRCDGETALADWDQVVSAGAQGESGIVITHPTANPSPKTGARSLCFERTSLSPAYKYVWKALPRPLALNEHLYVSFWYRIISVAALSMSRNLIVSVQSDQGVPLVLGYHGAVQTTMTAQVLKDDGTFHGCVPMYGQMAADQTAVGWQYCQCCIRRATTTGPSDPNGGGIKHYNRDSAGVRLGASQTVIGDNYNPSVNTATSLNVPGMRLCIGYIAYDNVGSWSTSVNAPASKFAIDDVNVAYQMAGDPWPDAPPPPSAARGLLLTGVG